MKDQSHMNALRLRRSNEMIRLENAKSEKERALRKVWLDQLDREIGAEGQFAEISDDDLLAELSK